MRAEGGWVAMDATGMHSHESRLEEILVDQQVDLRGILC